jgi:serine protease Do
VTSGIISAVNRDIMESPFDDYLQTDAAINHGNSGGPVFNLSGQVIAMASVLYAPGSYSGSAGVGFAIPSNLLSFVLGRLEKNGRVAAGMLPLRTQPVPEMMAAAIGAPGPGGALVIELTAQAEAMVGMIQAGDVIRSFDGTIVLDPRDLARKALRAKVGNPVTLELCRAGQMVSVEVPILPFTGPQPIVRQSAPAKTLGLHLAALSGTDNKSGVTVEAIDPSGSIADSGLRKGDVIVRVQQRLVSTPQQALAELQTWTDSKQPYAALLVERDKKLRWMPVALPN